MMKLRWLLRRLLFTDAWPIIRIGRVRSLTPDDAPEAPWGFHPDTTSARFEHLNTEHFGRFILSAYAATGSAARNSLIFNLLLLTALLVSPLLLAELLRLLPNVALHPEATITIAICLGLTGVTSGLFAQQFYYHALSSTAALTNGINKRVVLHALRLQNRARNGMQTGDLVNHLSSDTDAIAECAFFLPDAMGIVIRIAGATALLWTFLGPATLASIAAMLILTPLSALAARRYRKLDHKLMEHRDARVTLMAQLLQGIRVIKYQGWENSVHSEVSSIRKSEVRKRLQIVNTDAMSTALLVSVTTLVAFTGLATFVLLGGQLTVSTVFASLALFALLEDPFGSISQLLASVQHARVATGRLHAFFSAATRPADERELSAPSHPVGISLNNVTVRYSDRHFPSLSNITCTIPPGSSVAIVGSVGSGKSVLLRLLAGIQECDEGSLQYTNVQPDLRPRIGYVPQEAFILNASVEDNIRFGLPETFHGDLRGVIEDCALLPDVAAMPAGLRTEIGERGVNLSGGQKQRISLARAAYAQPGLLVLDDPLSAVDPATEHHLADALLFGRLQGVTRIVATHRLDHLERFDMIIVLNNGRITAIGSYAEVRDSIADTNLNTKGKQARADPPPVHRWVGDQANGSESSSGFVIEEDRDTGAVKSHVFRTYTHALLGTGTYKPVLIALALVGSTIAITLLPMTQTWWMAYWSDTGIMSPLAAVVIFGGIGAIVLIGWIAERLLWLRRAAIAGLTLHDNALQGVLYAPLRFFDTTPIGRILNRFSRDQESVDDRLSSHFELCFKSVTKTLGSVILAVSILPILIIVIIPVLYLYYRLQRDYRMSAREAKRIESVSRSPRYAQFKEMVTGLDVIHSFGRESWFEQGYHHALVRFQRAFYCSILLNRWFSVRVPLVSGIVGIATTLTVVLMSWHDALSTGTAGLVLTYALSFWGNLEWTIRSFSEVESRMTSVERLGYYGALPAEADVTLPPPLAETVPWPVHGAIRISNITVRYASTLPPVIHNLSAEIPPRSIVGIVGRTGSGKSTVFQTLYRFINVESGSIEIDCVNINSIPLHRLRTAMAIIPQDPTLFIGTIRSNLDRYGQSADAQVWEALQRVQLATFIQQLPDGLYTQVAEGGVNFSQGQRQLLCMARAILSNARIIVLDEATASVDGKTDMIIQQTIRREFRHATVLIIAHRINTVQDCNVIIRMDAQNTLSYVTKSSLPVQE